VIRVKRLVSRTVTGLPRADIASLSRSVYRAGSNKEDESRRCGLTVNAALVALLKSQETVLQPESCVISSPESARPYRRIPRR
jgi:hypothetical protein